MDSTVEALRRHLPPGAAPAHLIGAARDLAFRMRDQDPADIHAELSAKSVGHLARLAMTLAGMVPVDSTATELLAWAGATPAGPDEESLRMAACYEIAYKEAELDHRHARQREEASAA